jgi:hypothetical protein
MGVFLMSIFGKIGHAIGGAFKAVGHGLAEVGKQIGLAAEGVVSGFLLKPVAGVVSIFSQDLADKIKLPNQDQVDHSFMGKLGEFAGTALGFVGGTALLRGVGMGVTAARVGIGAVEGLAGSKDGSLWDKIKGAGIGALTAGAAGQLGDKVANWVQKGEDTVLHPLVTAGAPRVVTQGADHVMDAELSSLVQRGHFAGWKEMIPAAAVSSVVSDAGEHINDGIDKLLNKLPQNEATGSLSRVLHAEESSLARTGRFADSGVVISQAVPDSMKRAVMHQAAPAIDRLEQRLPGQARSAVNDMLDGFILDGAHGAMHSAERTAGQTLHQYAERILPNHFHAPDHVENRSPRGDRQEVRA